LRIDAINFRGAIIQVVGHLVTVDYGGFAVPSSWRQQAFKPQNVGVWCVGASLAIWLEDRLHGAIARAKARIHADSINASNSMPRPMAMFGIDLYQGDGQSSCY